MEYIGINRADYQLIRIKGLKVFAHHGVLESETENGQNFYINAELSCRIGDHGQADAIELTTNYASVCEFITDWMQKNTYNLLETVTDELCAAILCSFPLVDSVTLEVEKPEAPIDLPFECVSVERKMSWHWCVIGIGSNMGDKRAYVTQAIKELDEERHTSVLKQSSLILTEAYGYTEQDDFLNGVVLVKTLLTPKALLSFLHTIETRAGRERIIHWGPRTLDLDILTYDDLVYEDPDLVIPHIDMQNREFVLEPFCQVAPNYRHPILRKTIKELLDDLRKENAD